MADPTTLPTGPSSDLGALHRSPGLSTSLPDRVFSPEVARERLREAIWDDLGLILRRPNLENHRFIAIKPRFLPDRLFRSRRRLGAHLGCPGVPFGSLGRPSWPSEASLGRPGALPGRSREAPGAPRERSWEASWRSWGALGATWRIPTPPGAYFGMILGRLGGRLGPVW